jgi:GT2 family glycosyltransferase
MVLRALDSALSQSRRPHEIIVVNNLPGDDTISEMVSARDPLVRIVNEHCEGLDFARNRALREATGSWVLFIDDDVVLARDALEKLARQAANGPSPAVVNGRVRPLSLEHAGQRLFERNAGFDRGESLRVLERSGTLPWRSSPIHRVVSVGSGCCMAIHRQTALALGGFDEALDLGAALGGGGDLDMYWRIAQAGGRVVYDPTVVALHEHRRDTADAVAQIQQHHAGLIVFLSKARNRGTRTDRMMTHLFLAWRLAKPCIRYLKALLGADPLRPAQAAELIRVNWAALRRYGALRHLAATRAGSPAS